uniref:Cholecystokinin n=1 Tax=Blarina brevicauda TaxID=9387 RepID=A0A7D5B8H7_BLABR|nr:cholecystokinin [Blarina brevicauda]
MNSCVCLCVLMAVLGAGVLALPVPSEDAVDPGALQPVEMEPRREQRAVQRVDGDTREHLNALLAKFLQRARKVPSSGMPVRNLKNLNPSHRINDRDYMGWMDFGRRSAEEYE